MITIKQLKTGEEAQWDEYVMSSSKGTFYHLSGWKEVIRKAYGLTPRYLAAFNQSHRVVGILPLFLMRNVLGKSFLISNPYSNYCGTCSDSAEIEEKLIAEAMAISRDNNTQYLELRCLGEGPGDPDRVRAEFVNMMLDLSPGEDEIWNKRINSKVRNSVRKGIKSELEFDHGKHYLDAFYRVFTTNMRDLGTPPHSRLFFQTLVETFGDSIEIFVAKHQGKVIGSMFGFFSGSVFSEPWASTLRDYNRYCAADFLYWEAIRHVCKKGFQTFDFGRSTINTGTYQFKKKWGAEPVAMSYAYYLNHAKQAPVVNAVDSKYALAVKVWQKLPLIVANSMGPFVIKFLPEL